MDRNVVEGAPLVGCAFYDTFRVRRYACTALTAGAMVDFVVSFVSNGNDRFIDFRQNIFEKIQILVYQM